MFSPLVASGTEMEVCGKAERCHRSGLWLGGGLTSSGAKDRRVGRLQANIYLGKDLPPENSAFFFFSTVPLLAQSPPLFPTFPLSQAWALCFYEQRLFLSRAGEAVKGLLRAAGGGSPRFSAGLCGCWREFAPWQPPLQYLFDQALMHNLTQVLRV